MQPTGNNPSKDSPDPKTPRPSREVTTGTGNMRSDWNLRAKDDFHLAIANYVGDDAGERLFRESGQEDAQTVINFLEQVVAQHDNESSSWRVLDYGCGVGRVLVPLSSRFGQLDGLDISDEMVTIGRERLSEYENIDLHVLEEKRFPFEDASFDLIYSLRVFQHMPKSAFKHTVKEVSRVLRPGGAFVFHLTYPFTARRLFQAITGRDYGENETYRRRYYTLGRIRNELNANNMDLVVWKRTDKKNAWYVARRRD